MFVVFGRPHICCSHISSDIGDAFDDAYDAGSYPTGHDFLANCHTVGKSLERADIYEPHYGRALDDSNDSEPKFESQPEPGDLVAKPDAHHGAERDAFDLALEDGYCESQRVTECITIVWCSI
jgi:hypothetical protein